MIEFLFPERLLALLLLIPGGFYLAWSERLRARRLSMLSIKAKNGLSRIIAPLLCMGILITALAHPYTGFRDVPIATEGRDVIIAVDVSLSMLAQDASPSRLETAKRKIFDLLDIARTRSLPLRFGIVTFAGSAFRYCPITDDYEVVREFAEALSPDVTTSRGSSLEHAVDASLQNLARVKSQRGAILLLSDGEDLEFKSADVEDEIKRSGVPIYTIGIGATDGVPIPIGGNRYFPDPQGNIVITKLTEATLQKLAELSGGIYSRAQFSNSDLDLVAAHLIDSSSGLSKSSKDIRVYNEIGPWCIEALLAAVALLLVLRRENVLFALLLTLYISPLLSEARADSPKAISSREAYEAYERGDYTEAAQGFEALHAANPDDRAVTHALAGTRYKLKDYDSAAKLFDSLIGSSKTGRDRYEAEYNSGNSNLMRKDLDTAIARYEEALKVKPQDTAAEANLALAKKLKELQQKQQQQQQNQSSSQNKSQNSSSSQSSSKQSSSQQSSDQSSANGGSSSSSSTSGGSSESSSSSSTSSAGGGSSSSASQSSSSSSENGSQSSQNSNGASESANSSPNASSESGDAQSSESSSASQSSSSSALASSSSSAGAQPHPAKAPTPSARPTIDPMRALDTLDDRPLLPKRNQNRDTDSESGQTW